MVSYNASYSWNRHPNRSRYDRRMIRDFLSHLLWELRAAEFDYQQQRLEAAEGHPELDEVPDRYFQEYGVGLLPLAMVDDRDATPAQVWAARREVRSTIRAKRQLQLRLLEALWPVLEEALECADPVLWEESQVPVRVIQAREIRPVDDDEPTEPPGRSLL